MRAASFVSTPPAPPRLVVLAITCGLVLAILGVVSIMLGRWFGPALTARQAEREGRTRDALESYRVAEQRLAGSPLARSLLPRYADAVIGEELALLYTQKSYDEVIDTAAAASSGAARFWAGCALFAKADVDVDSKNQMAWMIQSQKEFRSALDTDPANADARFNYELSGRIIDSMRKDPSSPPPREPHLLTPTNSTTVKKVS